MRRLVFSLVGLALLGAILAPMARAASTVQATCSDFGSKLTAAGPGDTIVLTGLCGAPNNSFTLPATANLTIQGAASGTNGFDGTASSTPALATPAGGTDGITIRNLTFQNYHSSNAVRILSPAPAVNVANQYSFSGDQFLNNANPIGRAGGLDLEVFTGSASGSCTAPTPTVSLTGSTFSGNSGPFEGGGALLEIECRAGSPSMTVANNTFTGNTVDGGGAGRGGGLYAGPSGDHTGTAAVNFPLTQSGNLFSGNSATGTSAFFLAGGGEATTAADVTSISDTYVNNSLSGMSAAGRPRWGAGLTTAGFDCTGNGATSTFTNLVAAANTIGAPTGTGTGGQGAGVYAGCNPGGGGYSLTLKNPTIAGNTATGSGAVAGIYGETSDTLNVQNGIVFGNQGGPDLGGFGASPAANVTAVSSDLCGLGTSTPFAGATNICVDPLLVNPAGGDVHETASSPTVDVGDNSLVTASTDAFGNPRILVGKTGDPAVVDMGAAEFGPAPAPAPSTTPPDNSFKIGKVKGKVLFVTVHAPGIVKVVQAGGGRQAAISAKKKKLLKPSKGSGGPGTIKVKLKLTKKANMTLKKKGKLKISSKVTFTPTGGTANGKRTTLKLTKKKHH